MYSYEFYTRWLSGLSDRELVREFLFVSSCYKLMFQFDAGSLDDELLEIYPLISECCASRFVKLVGNIPDTENIKFDTRCLPGDIDRLI